MNPIALIEVTAAVRSAVLGALAADPVMPSWMEKARERYVQRWTR